MRAGNFCHEQHNKLSETDIFEKWFSITGQRWNSNISDPSY